MSLRALRVWINIFFQFELCSLKDKGDCNKMYVENWKTEEVCLRGFVSQCFKKNDEEKHKNFLASLATLLHCCTGAKNLECNCCQAQCLCVPDVVEAVGFWYPSLKCIISTQHRERVLLRLSSGLSMCG